MTKRIVLIGGPAAGRVFDVSTDQQWFDFASTDPSVKTVRYRIATLIGMTREVFYVGIYSDTDPIGELLSHYVKQPRYTDTRRTE